MPKASAMATHIGLSSIKVLFIIPAAFAAFGSRKAFNVVNEIPELQQPPYDPNVLLAHLLTYVCAMTILAWLFVSVFFLLWKWKQWTDPWILAAGLIDLGLALILGIGVGMKANYLPGSSRGCSNAQTWQVVGDDKSFFAVLADVKKSKDAQTECRWLVDVWAQDVVCFDNCARGFQLLVAYGGVFFDEREHSMLNPFRPLLYLVNLILAIIIVPFWLCTNVTPPIRFAYHYVHKLSRRTREKPVEFDAVIPYTPQYEHITVSNRGLHQIFIIEHVLLNVVDNLHYEDIINLSLTAKAVREAVFPGQDLAYRIPKLKKRTCNEDSKTPCLYCKKNICCDCRVSRFYPGLPGRRHVEMCTAYCANCYYIHFSRHDRDFKKPCKCTITDKAFEFQQVCRTCSVKDPGLLRDARFKRYQQEARDIAQGKHLPAGEKVKCGSCKEDLKSGTRWWVCGKCKGECRDAIHPAFVKNRKVMDAEKVVGLERQIGETEGSMWAKWVSL
ncbi:hypothetical protein K504DRAFT_446118 [Pleomassaria siparia CBS 279.74]|uniref:Uncharacterized protein n=1 Tax=Pleomassaria siparia CBS 279.74 TaxID=1314801 RepID=A0A6G1KQU9_9PLEO|nr:hypothetical protein K504DRAFT_446118 [Pleomassaria siparia CBS 279.74]